MNKSEIKRDPIAEKIVQFIAYLKNNLKLVFIILIILIGFVIAVSWNISINQDKEDKGLKEADKIMIKLISSASNNTIDSSIKDSIDKLYINYPNSEAVNYLGLLLIELDSLDSSQRINSIKNNITNEWFKTQAFLISGDYYSDKLDYESAKKDYEKAIEYASSNAQNGYCHYKLGNIYFEMENLSLAMEYYKKADVFFNSSKKSKSLERDVQFQSWNSRNKIALHRTENLLKK